MQGSTIDNVDSPTKDGEVASEVVRRPAGRWKHSTW